MVLCIREDNDIIYILCSTSLVAHSPRIRSLPARMNANDTVDDDDIDNECRGTHNIVSFTMTTSRAALLRSRTPHGLDFIPT